MSAPKSTPREQDQTIKERKQLLFEADVSTAPVGPRKPFAEYLRDTPAEPLPLGVKASLWAAGVVVVLILLAALLRSPRPRGPATPTPAANARLDRLSTVVADT